MSEILHTYLQLRNNLENQSNIRSRSLVPYYTASQIATMYNIPTPTTSPMVVGVVSFGGGLYGNLASNGLLTGGDVQAYWSYIGIPIANHPKVIVVPIGGAQNRPSINDGGSTAENTLDVETIGGCCPSANLTIILYIAPNALSSFVTMFNYMLTTPVIVDSVSYKPTIISCSWGLAELYYPSSLLTQINGILEAAAASGINICTATGDNGSSNGVGSITSKNVDFPSSSPYVTAVGGTTLTTPAPFAGYVAGTIETAWSTGGGAVSTTFAKPSYQSSLPGSFRSVPDIALNADPNTGVLFIVNGTNYVYGGTSVSAPIFAAFLAAIKATTFVNPSLYAAPSTCFHDIVSGSNGGYTATGGYDNCTGLGSIIGNLLSTAILFGTPPINVSEPVTSITLSAVSPLYINAPGNTVQLTATVNPTTATNPALTWSVTNNSNVLRVSQTGLVTAAGLGSATVVARSVSNPSVAVTSGTITVTQPVTSVAIIQKSATLVIGSSLQLGANVFPTNAGIRTVSWSSATPSVATVNLNTGLVTAISAGTSVISIVANDGSGKTASISVTVTPIIRMASIGVSVTNPIRINRSYTPTVTFNPTNATNKAITWTSSSPLVASVSSTGIITGKSVGSCRITATTVDGSKTVSISLTVVRF